MARTAPVPNIPAIPGMCPGIAVLAGGAGSGGSGGRGAGSGSGKNGAAGEGGAGSTPADERGAPDYDRYPGCGYASHPVDVVTGRAFTHPATDLDLRGPLPLRLERSYRSASASRDSNIGFGWSHSFGWDIEVKRQRIVVRNERGAAIGFDPIEVGGETVGRFGWVLRREQWGYLVDANDGLWHVFSQPYQQGGREHYRLTAIEDRNKNRISVIYEDDRLVELHDSVGRVVRIENNTAGRISAIKVKNAPQRGQWVNFAHYEYDDRGNLTRATDAAGYSWRYEYDDRHRMVAETSRAGLTFHFTYDAADRCIESWGDYGSVPDPSLADDLPERLADGVTKVKGVHHCRFTYFEDNSSEVADSTQVRRFAGNDQGMLDARVDGSGITTASYDAQSHITAITDAVGSTSAFMRDARGRILEAVDALNRTTKIERGDHGLPIAIYDANGAATIIDRDQRGNAIAVTDGTGAVTRFDYDARGLMTAMVQPDGSITRYQHDEMGNLLEVTMPNGGSWRYRYDEFGKLVSITDPAGAESRFNYSRRGELLAAFMPNGAESHYLYDGDGHMIQSINAQGQRAVFTWGGYERLCTRTDAQGGVLRFRYNYEGELVCVQNPKGEEHRFQYDTGGFLISETTFDGRQIAYTNDVLGKPVRIIDDSGITTLEYDPMGQLVEREHPDGSAESFKYDLLGSLTSAVNSSGTFTFERDALGRVVRETQTSDGVSHWVSFGYDAQGRPTEKRTSLGHVEQVSFSPIGSRQATTLMRQHEAEGSITLRHQVDVFGREVARLLESQGSIATAYDALGRIERRRALSANAPTPLAAGQPQWLGTMPSQATVDLAYRYDGAGHLIQHWDQKRGATNYRYDALSQLLGLDDPKTATPKEQYAFDRAGNIYGDSNEPRAYGPGGRLLRRGDTDYRYNEQGQLVEKRAAQSDGAANEPWLYDWTSNGQLQSVTTPDGLLVEMAYDPFSRRTNKKVTRVDNGSRAVVSHTRFVWSADVLVHELKTTFDEQGDPIVSERTYCFDQGMQPLAHRDRVEGQDEQPWIHYLNDQLGTPHSLIAGDGRVVAEIEQSTWGKSAPAAEGAVSTQIRFVGQYADDETGLHYNRHRYYDPESGNYISPDPLRIEGGMEPYRYAPNPLSYIDPFGQAYATWNEFQAGTAGQFATRQEAATGWKVYKETNRDCATTPAIGRLADTAAAETAGYRRLNTTGWTPAVNDAWVQGGIDRNAPFHLATPPTAGNLHNPPGSTFPNTVFHRELNQLQNAGYTPSNCGTYMAPPGDPNASGTPLVL